MAEPEIFSTAESVRAFTQVWVVVTLSLLGWGLVALTPPYGLWGAALALASPAALFFGILWYGRAQGRSRSYRVSDEAFVMLERERPVSVVPRERVRRFVWPSYPPSPLRFVLVDGKVRRFYYLIGRTRTAVIQSLERHGFPRA